MKKGQDKLVWSGYVILLIYNIFSVSGVFESSLNYRFTEFYVENFGTLVLLEFVLVAALFVNIILNYDEYRSKTQIPHLILTALMLVLFLLKLVFYFMGSFKVM